MRIFSLNEITKCLLDLFVLDRDKVSEECKVVNSNSLLDSLIIDDCKHLVSSDRFLLIFSLALLVLLVFLLFVLRLLFLSSFN